MVDMEMGSLLTQWPRPSKTALFLYSEHDETVAHVILNPLFILQGPTPADQADRPFIINERRELAIHDKPIA